MDYERKKKEVQAVKLVASIFDVDGNPLATKGDWLVIENGKQYYMTDAEFTEEFQPKNQDAPKDWLAKLPRDRPYPVPYPVPQPMPIYPRPWWTLDFPQWRCSKTSSKTKAAPELQAVFTNCTYESRA